MEKDEFAQQMRASINHAILAHSNYAKKPEGATRNWDGVTPYAIHPIWCAMTLLTETRLLDEIRLPGYQALLWHDILEDTNSPLPDDVSPYVRELVEEMTFESFEEERQKLWARSDVTKLLKLYDKVSNLLDAKWMASGKHESHVEHALKLVEFVKAKYGDLNIVKIATAICGIKA